MPKHDHDQPELVAKSGGDADTAVEPPKLDTGGAEQARLSWLGAAFTPGYAAGTYVDRKFIEPLW